MLRLLCIIPFFATFTNGFAQGPDSLWSRTFGGAESDQAFSVQQTSDGGYVLGGSTHSFGLGANDFWMVKTTSEGDTVWTHTYGNRNNDIAHCVRQTSDDGYILAGYTDCQGEGQRDFMVVKTDTDGRKVWSRTYGGGEREEANAIRQTSDGGYIIVGYTRSFGAGNSDVWLVKTDDLGFALWTQTFGGPGDDAASSVQQTADGGYILAGWTDSYGSGSYDFWLIKTDADGYVIWSHTFGGDLCDEAHSVQQTADGGYIITGLTCSFGSCAYNYWLVKADANGDYLWSQFFGVCSYEIAWDVHESLDGGFIIAGWTSIGGTDNDDFWLVKTNSQGENTWSRTFGGMKRDIAYSVQQTSDGGYIMAGESNSFGAGQSDMWLIKIAPDLSSTDTPQDITPMSYSLQNYPNPFNPTTEILYSLPGSGPVTLRIFDALGRQVTTLANGVVPAGSYKTRFDGSNLPSGIYFCQLQTPFFSQSQKLVLLK